MRYDDNTQLARYIIMDLKEKGYNPYLDRFSIKNSKLLYKYLMENAPEYTAMMDASYQYTKLTNQIYKYELKPNTKYSLITKQDFLIGIPDSAESAENFEDTEMYEKIDTLDSTIKVLKWHNFTDEFVLSDGSVLDNVEIKSALVMTIHRPNSPSTANTIIVGVKKITWDSANTAWKFTQMDNTETSINDPVLRISIVDVSKNIFCYFLLGSNTIKVADFSGMFIEAFDYENMIEEVTVIDTVKYIVYQSNNYDFYTQAEELIPEEFFSYDTTVQQGLLLKSLSKNITADNFTYINNVVPLYTRSGTEGSYVYTRATTYTPGTTYYIKYGINYIKYNQDFAMNLYTNTYFNSIIYIDGNTDNDLYFMLPYYNIINGYDPLVTVEKPGCAITTMRGHTFGCYSNMIIETADTEYTNRSSCNPEYDANTEIYYYKDTSEKEKVTEEVTSTTFSSIQSVYGALYKYSSGSYTEVLSYDSTVTQYYRDKLVPLPVRITYNGEYWTYKSQYGTLYTANTLVTQIRPICVNFLEYTSISPVYRWLNLFTFGTEGNIKEIRFTNQADTLYKLYTNGNLNDVSVNCYKYDHVNNVITQTITGNFANTNTSPEFDIETKTVTFNEQTFTLGENECFIINANMKLYREEKVDDVITYVDTGKVFNYKVVIFSEYAIGYPNTIMVYKFENDLVNTYELELTSTLDIIGIQTGDVGIVYIKSANEKPLSDLPVLFREQGAYAELLETNQVTTTTLDMILLGRIITPYSPREDIEYLQQMLGLKADGVWNNLMTSKIVEIKKQLKLGDYNAVDCTVGPIFTDVGTGNSHKFVTSIEVTNNKNELFTKDVELAIEQMS